MDDTFGYDEATFEEDVDANAREDDAYGDEEALADQPVPRISMAAFCELPETAGLITTAADDRRMARANVEVEMGGLPVAIETFHDNPTPNLIVVESGMRGRALFEQLDELANVCDPDTRVIVIGAANDIALYRELMRRGVSEYLVPPMNTLGLIRAVASLYSDPDEPFLGKAIAFIGAKGGSGSSTIAHNVAWCVAEEHKINTSLVDLDLNFGTAGLDFNQDTNQGVGDALSQPDRVDDTLLDRLVTRCTERLMLFAAPASLDREWDLGPDAFETVVEAVRKTAPMVALDLPHLWSGWSRRLVMAADEVIITTTPELASLRNSKAMYDLVAAARPNDVKPKLVLNQVGVPKRPEITPKDFADALGVEPDLIIPFDPQLFGTAANNGQMITELKADAKPAEGIRGLAAHIAGRETVKARKGLFQSLMQRK